jgi:hypothetical protein
MTLEQALAELGEQDPHAFPAMSRRYGATREALRLAGDDETVARLDRAFEVVSTNYWSVVEPSIRFGYEAVRDGPPVGAYPPGEVTTISAEDYDKMPVKGPGAVTLRDRQGVFVHTFKCSLCDLEFVVFSWRADRHRVGTTFCPECGERTPMIHWRAQTSDSLDFRSDGPGLEICQVVRPLQGSVMDDTVMPPDDRYAVPEVQVEPITDSIADDDMEIAK